MAGQKKSPSVAEAVAQLCPQCGICCNGVLFKDVELQPGDDAGKLKTLGLPVTTVRLQKFPQPCAALDGCRCRIYADRPVRCREFECALLKSVVAGEMEVAPALKVIQQTQRRVENVKRLLRKLGSADELLALSLRFKQVKRQIEMSPFDEEKVDLFGESTLAVHDLNLLLRKKFYPSASD